MKKVLIISTTLRANGNSCRLAKEFMAGALSAGNQVEMISLIDKKIAFCKGCMACAKLHKCVINDDSLEIVEKMRLSDVIVFATPIYYYEMCGQMKTLLDRANPLFSAQYNFRDIYLIATAADTDEHATDGAVMGLNGWISCFEKASFKGLITGLGVTDIGDTDNDKQSLLNAYNCGAKV